MTIARSAVEGLTSDLIAIDARNPWLIADALGEGAIASEVASRAAAIPGVEVVVEEVEPGRPNVLARLRGTGGGPVLCLNAHVDTVGDSSWPERAMRPVVAGDRLLGSARRTTRATARPSCCAYPRSPRATPKDERGAADPCWAAAR